MVFSEAAIHARRERVATCLGLSHEVLLVGAGQPIPLPENTDQTYPFRAHTEYFYLTGLDAPGGVVAFDPTAGWKSFVPTVTQDERVWEGRTQPPGEPLENLSRWLAARPNRPIVNLGASVPAVSADARLYAGVRERFHHARRPKDPAEVALLRQAAEATTAGFAAIQPWLRAGVTERAIQIELEAAFQRAGARRTGYGTIVGTGPNAAVLHFDPSQRLVQEGEFVLIDAGAEVDRYVCDVTRTYVIGGRPSAFQRDLYQLVLEVEQRAVAACRPGVEWKDLHLRAAVELTAGLVDMGILRGSAESLVETEAHRLFFPHGLGHLVGLGVRDASGTELGRTKDPRPALRFLRTDLPLRPGYVITVEPGLYFIPPLLDDPERRERYRDAVNWDLVERHRHLGGVRIEDNILVTEGEPDVLTSSIPKKLD
jgi:Xaa-Pro aminopeptidase